MKDLTHGSVGRHVAALSGPIAVGMLFQALYYLVDLYFVTAIGGAAVAGVIAVAGEIYLVLALSQILGVGTTVLVAHAVGRKDRDDANLAFNQSLVLAAVCGLVVLLLGLGLTRFYLESVAADRAIVEAGTTYIHWYLPGLALQFVVVSMASTLRGTGLVRPTMIVQVSTVMLNTVLAPILIAGWGTHHPLGVAGAGLTSSLSVAVAVILFVICIRALQVYVAIDYTKWRPRLVQWRRVLKIGVPAGGEFALLFVYTAITYWAIREFGAATQAGFGVGTRILQVIVLPVMAVALAVRSVAGQNFGARQMERVRQTLRAAAFLAVAIMLAFTVLLRWRSNWLVAIFTDDREIGAAAMTYLRLLSLAFVAHGLNAVYSAMFQGLGNTRPALLTSATRLLIFGLCIFYLVTRSDFYVEQVWYCVVATLWFQVFLNVIFLQSEYRKRLLPHAQPSSPAAVSSARSEGFSGETNAAAQAEAR